MIVDEEEEEMEDKPNQQQTYVSGNIMVMGGGLHSFQGGEGNSFQFPPGFFPSGNFSNVPIPMRQLRLSFLTAALGP